MYKVKVKDEWLHSVRQFPRAEGGIETSVATTPEAGRAMPIRNADLAIRLARLAGGEVSLAELVGDIRD